MLPWQVHKDAEKREEGTKFLKSSLGDSATPS